jgi:hypothetical protein
MVNKRGLSVRLFHIFAIPALLPIAAFADAPPSTPDPRLTPGAVAGTDPAIVCARGYSRSHPVWHDKIGTLAKYGIALADEGQYEDDDSVRI